MDFENIRNISLSDDSSWRNKIFITLDIDWTHDDVLEYTLEFVKKTAIKTTLFCTHESELISNIKDNKKIELGVHPNFNKILDGNFSLGANVREVISYYREIIPDAVSVRSHSLTQSSLILSELHKCGYRFESNTFIPYDSGIALKPWGCRSETLIRVPYFWGDEYFLSTKGFDNFINDKAGEKFLSYRGLKVFNFHPIHIYLNTDNLGRYHEAKSCYHDISRLRSYRNKSRYGIYDFFMQLIEAGQQYECYD